VRPEADAPQLFEGQADTPAPWCRCGNKPHGRVWCGTGLGVLLAQLIQRLQPVPPYRLGLNTGILSDLLQLVVSA
jgi:hypothetical protein